MPDLHVAIISSERPNAVERMEKLLGGLEPTWYVPIGQEADYAYAGAENVQPVRSGWDAHTGGEQRPTISDQRNVALDDAAERWCVQFNDDLAVSDRFPTGLNIVDEDGDEHPTEPAVAVRLIIQNMEDLNAHLGGCAATTNKFFLPKEPWGTGNFIMGQLMVMAPEEALRFNRCFGSKEDYDYTLQHLTTYGRVCRANRLLGNFKHNERRGGWANYRSIEEQRLLSLALVEKWKPHIIHNSRRDGEVLVKWRS